jgi:hypothetical protein
MRVLSIRQSAGVALLVIGSFYAGVRVSWDWRLEYERLEKAVPYYEPRKNSLYRGLAHNDFAYAFANREDLEILRREFSFLELEPTSRGKVLRLIEWIDRNTKLEEVTSVRALDLYRARSGACEIHALAVGVLTAFDIRARWIGGVKSAIGFGYLEAFVEGRWELFRLRSGSSDPSLHKSAWDLFLESEPSINVRSFWAKPGTDWKFWGGTVQVVLFPLANAREKPELETLFQTNRGIDVDYRLLNPLDYVYGYFGYADKEWIEAETLMEMFEWHLATNGMAHQRGDADWINWLGLTAYRD